MTMWLEKIIGDLSGKKRYLEYKKRIRQLPEGYRQAGGALERYLLNLGPSDNGESLLAMLEDLADLLEQSVAAGTPIRNVVGTDPTEFAESFMQNYGGGSWIRKERDRLGKAIDRAEEEDQQ
ncbi:hypothetical protein GCM10027404_33740 [Arthrobacter tumbae]|uniref:DUF1048 domain-containing protein n=1 Tax=Arthrobacter tumbae TaxID=163874 RepID=UPI0019563995|nr:DUF1048 domain-containing protein [Arthrobacter tumbae]MBM7781969.1 DNA-binding ferritin-like protein (Dps family) [Arthrobacter tumbae]